jgi:hypothetical protein
MNNLTTFLDRNIDAMFAFALAWVMLFFVVSLVYRFRKQRPLLVDVASDALFTESWASGRSNKNFITQLGGARNCLHVMVTRTDIEIRPHFPFVLFFLPEIFGLELIIPRTQIESIIRVSGLFLRGGVRVTYKIPNAKSRSVSLYLRDADDFVATLER